MARTVSGIWNTLASTKLGTEARPVGCLFKHHRPGGLLATGSEEPDALIELRAGNRQQTSSLHIGNLL